MNYWKHQEIRTIIDSMTPEMGSEDVKALTKKITRSPMAINSKILEIIGVKNPTKVVRDVIEEYQLSLFPYDGDFNQLIYGEFPNLDLSYIPSTIFASVMANRKLKLDLGDKVLFRSLDDVFRMNCFSSEMEEYFTDHSKICTIGGYFGKSFWLKEDDSEYPIQFHIDLVRKLIKNK